jgi:hypothetical protein
VYEYGLRMLLDIGISDPSANARFAAETGVGLDVDADPPPPLVFPGTDIPLTPDIIGADSWRTLAATFRVGDFPPPPPFWITTPLAWSQEASPQQQPPPTSGGQGDSNDDQAPPPPEPPPRLFKASRELTIPGGYQPTRFVACVLVDGPSDRYGDGYTAPDMALIKVLVEPALLLAPADVRDRLRQLINLWLTWDPGSLPRPDLTVQDIRWINIYLLTSPIFRVSGMIAPPQYSLMSFTAAASGSFRPGLEFAVGPALAWAAPGARKITGVFNYGKYGSAGLPLEIATAEAGGSVLPIAASTGGGQGFSMTIEVLSQLATAEQQWQYDAYNAILAAHSAWESDWRSSVAQAQIRRGLAMAGRNPQQNLDIIRSELKRSVIDMLGAPSASQLRAVVPGNPMPTGNPARPTPPSVDLARAGEAGRIVSFYEQAFEWQNMSYIFYPYFWTGRDDWPQAMVRDDPDPTYADFLRAGSARVVLPVRPGYERLVGSRLHLDLLQTPISPTAPQPSTGPYLDIAEEIRASQDATVGGRPTGPRWPVVVPTTLVALDGTPMPTFAQPGDPPGTDDANSTGTGDGATER